MACNINKLSLNNKELKTLIKTHPETNTFWVLGTKLRVVHTIVGKHLAQIDEVKKMQKFVYQDLTDDQQLTQYFF